MPKVKAAGHAIGFIVKYTADFFRTPRKLATKSPRALAAPPSRRALPTARPRLDPAVGQRIKAMPEGSRPDPSTYLSKADIDQHLKPFRESGAVRVANEDNIARRGTVGPAGGTFVMPRSQFDALRARCGGNLGQMETELGLESESLTRGTSVAVYIEPDCLRELRMPSGNEAGANALWEPGGYTSGGMAEATVNTPVDVPFTIMDLLEES
ncbi:MAG: hypothetical protein L0G99_02550 [Propionibacteriales bacterium]|nr:hypothetical protein [Propionibacteriales bacterium]